MTERLKREEVLMATAFLFSKRSTCRRRQVGAVLARGSRIISVGYNGAPSGFDHCTPETCNEENQCRNTVHAELNAILFAAKEGISTDGAIIYCTDMPCPACARAIINAGIKVVIYSRPYWNREGVNDLIAAGIVVHHMEGFENE